MLGFHVVVVLFAIFVNNADRTEPPIEKAYIAGSPIDCADGSNFLRAAAKAADYTMTEAACQGVYVADDGSSFTIGHDGE